jgi:hypothetical protein
LGGDAQTLTIKEICWHQRKRELLGGEGQPGGFIAITVASLMPSGLGQRRVRILNHQLPHVQARKGGLFCERIFGPVKDSDVPAVATTHQASRRG